MTNGQHYSVTFEEFKTFNPCSIYSCDDFKYSKQLFNGRDKLSLDDIIELDIRPIDKVWISDKIVSRREMAKLQVLWAYQALSFFECEFPNDQRPRKAVQKLEEWINNPSDETMKAWISAKDDALTVAKEASERARRIDGLNVVHYAVCATANNAAWETMLDVANAIAEAATRMIFNCLRNIVWEDVWDTVHNVALNTMLCDLKDFAKAECIS